ncbi:hypothetical protein Caci_2928 [Catenulispora acidiphila DSM 44928]|uniref:Uncharacterized protein n=1 Tax=Catenulispora acidiphila (strain DSM 44928 / JCM 14897 / NBRC 102108 / NRRL B-24433 / ID139908) TaxID=479433 RepID=C7Q2U5_CATAD|nr:hypothetical protein [Catenulispora acidiphila]ACU71837.1 hypothetical protein Caci_2928 [Catenulispora acidiphila DSM 44928]
MTDTPTEPYALSDKGLEEIRRRVTGTCSCCGENVHDFDTADVLELLDDVDRLRSDAYAEAVEKYATDMAERARIRSMEIRGGTFNLSLEDAQEMCAAYVATARTMLGDAENYSETRVDFPKEKCELEVKLAGELDQYVLTAQRAGKLTPHEARVKAEEEAEQLREQGKYLLTGVEVVLLDHASELSDPAADPNLTELAVRYLTEAGDGADAGIRSAVEREVGNG